jgi:hypothetical protein
VGWRDVFVEVPIKIHNSSLAQALIADLNPAPGATAGDLERLSLANAGYLSKTMSNLIECMDDMLAEQGKVNSSAAAGVCCVCAGRLPLFCMKVAIIVRQQACARGHLYTYHVYQ